MFCGFASGKGQICEKTRRGEGEIGKKGRRTLESDLVRFLLGTDGRTYGGPLIGIIRKVQSLQATKAVAEKRYNIQHHGLIVFSCFFPLSILTFCPQVCDFPFSGFELYPANYRYSHLPTSLPEIYMISPSPESPPISPRRGHHQYFGHLQWQH